MAQVEPQNSILYDNKGNSDNSFLDVDISFLRHARTSDILERDLHGEGVSKTPNINAGIILPPI